MVMFRARLYRALFIALIACFSLFTLRASAVQSSNPPSSVPSDSTDTQALLLQAAQLNGLTGSDVKPWHMKVSFTQFDDGKTVDSGTIEEFWAGADKYKIVYAGSKFSQSEYGISSGTVLSGSAHLLPELLGRAVREFTDPIPYMENQKLYEHADVRLKPWETGDLKMQCVYVFFQFQTLSKPGDTQTSRGPTFCVTNGLPVLRSSMIPLGNTETGRNHYVNFSGHYIPSDIEIEKDKKLVLKAHLETLEPLAEGDSPFTPPGDARPAPILISQTDAHKFERQGLECTSSLTYPRAAGISGSVFLRVLIDPKGHVADANVIDGPTLLIPAGMDAMKQCAFAPPQKNGVPVEATGFIHVNFGMSVHVSWYSGYKF